MRYRDLLLTLMISLALLADGAAARAPGARDATTGIAATLAGGVQMPRGPIRSPVRARTTSVASLPPGTDLLLAAPAVGIEAPALARALTRLGYRAQPVSALLAVVRVTVPAGANPAALAATLAATGLLAAVEPDVRVYAHRLPDDPLLVNQRPYLDAIRAPLGWDTVTTASAVTIAVVDTGVDVTHPDLAGRIAVNAAETVDGRDEDANGCIDDLRGCSFASPAAADPSCGYTLATPHAGVGDDEGHGTFVAGIIAAAGNNAVGGTGLVWAARVLPVKVLDCTATGRISDAAAGIVYAARAGARIIVVAFGSSTDARVLREAVAEATDRYGALVVASVGNEGSARVQFPAAYPGVLAVAGSGVARLDGSIDYAAAAVFSNSGPEVAIYAPALRLFAPVPRAACGQRGWLCVGDQPYARASGTSLAAPLVAGAAALLLARDPELSPALLIALLRDGAGTFVAGGRASGGGPALLDVAGALAVPLTTAALPGTSSGRAGPPAQGPAADRLR